MNEKITEEEIKRDISDTQKEIDDFSTEWKILIRRPQENRVRIYMLEGKISQRKSFVIELEKILEGKK